MTEPSPADVAEFDQFRAGVADRLNDAISMLLCAAASENDEENLATARGELQDMLMHLDRPEALTMLSMTIAIITGMLEDRPEVRTMFGFPDDTPRHS